MDVVVRELLEQDTSEYNSQLRIQEDYKIAKITSTSYVDVYSGDSRLGNIISTAAGDVITLTPDGGTTEIVFTIAAANEVVSGLKGSRSDSFGGSIWQAKVAVGDTVYVQYREAELSA